MSRCAKRRYRDEIGAKIALVNIQARSKKSSSEKRQERRAYHCPRCNGWHLTSQEKNSTEGPIR